MCACAVCGGEEEVETQIQKPAGKGGSSNTHKRAHRAREYSTMTGLVALSGGPVGGWEQGACAGEGGGRAIGPENAVREWAQRGVVGE